MTQAAPFQIDPRLDLVLERVVDLPPSLVWKAWTTPELLKQWFCPKPWSTIACEIDLRLGGLFKTVMCSPEGEAMPEGIGCYLEVVENERLIWTDALQPGYRPSSESFFTGMILLEPHGTGTKYTAIARHKNEEDAKKHAEMGFLVGWGIALDQLVETMKTHV